MVKSLPPPGTVEDGPSFLAAVPLISPPPVLVEGFADSTGCRARRNLAPMVMIPTTISEKREYFIHMSMPRNNTNHAIVQTPLAKRERKRGKRTSTSPISGIIAACSPTPPLSSSPPPPLLLPAVPLPPTARCAFAWIRCCANASPDWNTLPHSHFHVGLALCTLSSCCRSADAEPKTFPQCWHGGCTDSLCCTSAEAEVKVLLQWHWWGVDCCCCGGGGGGRGLGVVVVQVFWCCRCAEDVVKGLSQCGHRC